MPNPLISLLIGLALLALLAALFWPDRGFFLRWQQARRMSARVLREDALKYLYTHELEGRAVTLQSLAGEMGVSLDQAAQLLGEMTQLGLMETHDGAYALTPTGREVAVQVLRAHRLWERYLSEHSGYSEEEWHARADQAEHLLAPDEVDALAQQLGDPRFDPHGDPIPTAAGETPRLETKPLTHLNPGDLARIIHLEDQPELVYAQLVAEGLHPGMEILVVDKTPQRVRFLSRGNEHVLAPILAANVFVTPIPKEQAEGAIHPWGETLTSLHPGEEAEIVAVSRTMHPAERHRLLDLGVLPGARVRAEFESPLGEPVAYFIRGALIALRNDQAEKIFVRKMTPAPSGNGDKRDVALIREDA
ncbi:MAG TPA: DtxR family transcriptional regulator [Caldilineae bacterium]|nr:DtxR family transcriptional regulator [Caldilineae bacterium]